jgi:hypothetical protein
VCGRQGAVRAFLTDPRSADIRKQATRPTCHAEPTPVTLTNAQMVRRSTFPSARGGSSWEGPEGRWVRRLRWVHLVPEALGLSLRYRVGGRKRPLSSAMVEPEFRSAARAARPPVPTVLAVVRLVTSIWPFRTTCLVRAIVLARMLRRRGYPAEVVIGVSEEGVDRDPRFAHAWVEVDKAVGPPGFSELVRLVP